MKRSAHPNFKCPICNEPVKLETAKIDETGKAVHAECYVQSVVGKKPGEPITRPQAS